MLTAELAGGWKSTMMIGDELTATNSGKLRWKGTTKFVDLRDPLHDSMNQDDLRDKAVLLDHAKNSGEAPISGSGWTPASPIRFTGDDCED
jgi:hypothetical protein